MSNLTSKKSAQSSNFYRKIKIIAKTILERAKRYNLRGFLRNPSFCFTPLEAEHPATCSEDKCQNNAIDTEFNAPRKLLTGFTKREANYLKYKNISSGFYFGILSFVLLTILIIGSEGLANLDNFQNSHISFLNSSFKYNKNLDDSYLFFNQNSPLNFETPDLKIIEDGFVYGISTPRLVSTQTLGSIFGTSSPERKEIIEYSVQAGDTTESISQNFNISLNTLIWANNLSKNSTLKIGQNLVILPIDGITYIVKAGDTISEISKVYKAKPDDVVAFNNLANEGDIFIGDILIVPGGIMPVKPAPAVVYAQLADSFFIYPTEGQISQGLHWYNAMDIANKCGTPVYAAAAGTVRRTSYGWNAGGGNLITILHGEGVVTYYGHLMSLFVKTGDQVNVGDRIGLIGSTGKSTGCHLHFGVTGARNPLTNYSVGTVVKYK